MRLAALRAGSGSPGSGTTDDAAGARARELAAALGVRTVTARLLLRRGVASEEHGRRFLDPRLGQLRAPESAGAAMFGFTAAADRLVAAVMAREPIGLFGDYDADGVTTAALLASFLRDAGADVVARVARRDDGYGFTEARADELAAAGCRLVVTCDCGTSDGAAIGRMREAGVDVVVVDHHQVPAPPDDGRAPSWLALINPHQPGCAFPFKGLASVGVGFYLAAAVRTRLRAAGREAPDPRELLDLAALGTVADLVPLTDENRVLVAAGLRELGRGRRPGLRALLEAQGLLLPGRAAERALDTFDVGFRIAPLLNAPGRLGDAQLALDLLLERDPARAAALAIECQLANARRREIQERVFEEACARVDGDARGGPRSALVVAGEGWHPGVVGIVASKLVERYRLPAVVIGLDGDLGRGSARVPQGSALHLYRGLRECAGHLVRFGGHAAAAGLSVRREALAAFATCFDEAARAAERGAGEGARPDDGGDDPVVALDEVDDALATEIGRLGPFGMGNPEPRLLVLDALVESSRVVGERHLMLTLRQGLEERDGIAFRLAARDPGRGARVHASFVPEIDTFRGARRLRLRVLDFEPLDEAGGRAPLPSTEDSA
jgi:single-stranded-DNA-specific exonuclease